MSFASAAGSLPAPAGAAARRRGEPSRRKSDRAHCSRNEGAATTPRREGDARVEKRGEPRARRRDAAQLPQERGVRPERERPDGLGGEQPPPLRGHRETGQPRVPASQAGRPALDLLRGSARHIRFREQPVDVAELRLAPDDIHGPVRGAPLPERVEAFPQVPVEDAVVRLERRRMRGRAPAVRWCLPRKRRGRRRGVHGGFQSSRRNAPSRRSRSRAPAHRPDTYPARHPAARFRCAPSPPKSSRFERRGAISPSSAPTSHRVPSELGPSTTSPTRS